MDAGIAILLVVAATITLIALLWLFTTHLDRARIRRYIAGRGGKVTSIAWNPFGAGWFGERDSMIYKVRFRDGDGVVREAQCKTGMFSGVYFTNESVLFSPSNGPLLARESDRRVEPAADGSRGEAMLFDENRRLREENRRLREELDRLRSYREQ